MDIAQGARIVVERWLQAKRDDVLHFIVDENGLREADALCCAAQACGAVPKVSVVDSGGVQAGNGIEEMRKIMSYANAIVGATGTSFITTHAVSYALKHGARFLSLPLSTNDGTSLLEQEFVRMSPLHTRLLALPMLRALHRADMLHVTTPAGTDLTLNIRSRKPGLFNGVAARPGVCASASFEVYVPPVETQTNGTVVLDGSMGYIGLVSEPLELTFENGILTRIADTADGKRLEAYIGRFEDERMRCAAEFGIGLNRLSHCLGRSYIEDESAYGTFHIGMGRNLALGGKHDAPGHFDIVPLRPTITAGKTVIMRDGVACLSPKWLR